MLCLRGEALECPSTTCAVARSSRWLANIRRQPLDRIVQSVMESRQRGLVFAASVKQCEVRVRQGVIRADIVDDPVVRVIIGLSDNTFSDELVIHVDLFFLKLHKLIDHRTSIKPKCRTILNPE